MWVTGRRSTASEGGTEAAARSRPSGCTPGQLRETRARPAPSHGIGRGSPARRGGGAVSGVPGLAGDPEAAGRIRAELLPGCPRERSFPACCGGAARRSGASPPAGWVRPGGRPGSHPGAALQIQGGPGGGARVGSCLLCKTTACFVCLLFKLGEWRWRSWEGPEWACRKSHCPLAGRAEDVWLGLTGWKQSLGQEHRIGFLPVFISMLRPLPGYEMERRFRAESTSWRRVASSRPCPPPQPDRCQRSRWACRAHSHNGSPGRWLPAHYSGAADGKLSTITRRCRSSHPGILVNNAARSKPWPARCLGIASASPVMKWRTRCMWSWLQHFGGLGKRCIYASRQSPSCLGKKTDPSHVPHLFYRKCMFAVL